MKTFVPTKFSLSTSKSSLDGKHKVRFIGKCYVVLKLLRSSPKGNIYKAVSLKNFCFKLCVIKQGNPKALLDQYHRDMKDRLLWQKSVLQDLTSVVTPGYIDYFEEKEHSYLVMQYVDGVSLFEVVKDCYQDKTWASITSESRKKLLLLFIGVLDLVSSIHAKGYVHRDITDSNFMILKDGTLCILDFELSYSMKDKQPAPPFLLGTFGYVAPEQLKYAKPDYKEDIYSLGALLCFLLVNTPPVEFITDYLYKVEWELFKTTSDRTFSKKIIGCLSSKRSERPSINTLKKAVLTYLNKL